MFSKLIKKYKFIEKSSIEPRQADRILKKGSYKNLHELLSHPKSNSMQKKKIKTCAGGKRRGKSVKPELSLEKPLPSISGEGDTPDVASTKTPLKDTKINSFEAMQARLKAEYETRIKEETTQAYNRGVHEGQTNSVAVNDARIAEAKKIFDIIKAELDKSAGQFFDEIEKVATDMSMHLAGKIIGDAVNAVPDIVKANVDKCLALVAGAGEVQIKINPADYDTIKGYLPSLEQKSESRFSFVLDPDRNVGKGGCLVEFEGSVIDGRIETQFQKIREQMEILA